MNSKNKLSRNYDRAAWFYEKSAKLYSTNQIRASKRDQIKEICPGDKVLFLGVGAGEDAIMAARHGAQVTCIDISQKMLDRVQLKLDELELSAELICQSALEHDRFAYYDVCCANYFLNVFREQPMKEMMNYTARLVRSGGKYMIADVALAQGNLLAKAFNIAYLKFAMASYWLLGLVPFHKNYDYPANFSEAGLEFERVAYFRYARVGPVVFQNIVATRI